MNPVLEAWLAAFGGLFIWLAAVLACVMIADALGRRRGRRKAGKP